MSIQPPQAGQRRKCSASVDLVLPPDVHELVLNGADGLVVTLRNEGTNEEGQVVGLHATRRRLGTGNRRCARGAPRDPGRATRPPGLRDPLALQGRQAAAPVRLGPSQRTRRFRLFHTRDARDPEAARIEPEAGGGGRRTAAIACEIEERDSGLPRELGRRPAASQGLP
jgi:hypothetical protein